MTEERLIAGISVTDGGTPDVQELPKLIERAKESGIKVTEVIGDMMPYLSKYLGHSSPDDMFYYYHQVEEAFSIIKQKDQSASFVIPEVADEK